LGVILIGAGRYGNGLVGRKYAQGNYFGAKIDSVVDPNIEKIRTQRNYNLRNARTYSNLDDVVIDDLQNTVAEIALTPNHIPVIFNKIVEKGIKKVILPKPVATDIRTFESIKTIAQKNNVTALVTSNWHYSEITRFLKAILDKAQGKEVDPLILSKYQKELSAIDSNYQIQNVNIEYSKQDEVLTIPPPSQELPHVLQILQSTGLCNIENSEFVMDTLDQTEGRVHLKIFGDDFSVRHIYINSDLKKGKETKNKRERIVTIELKNTKTDSSATIIADYDAVFSNSKCIKSANISYKEHQNGNVTEWTRAIEEDNMDSMYNSIYSHFNGNDSDALTLEKYTPIAKMISKIQTVWNFCRTQKIQPNLFVQKHVKVQIEKLKNLKLCI